jgi:hypothetical protein
VAGDLVDGGGAAEYLAQLVDRHLDGVLQVLGPAGHVHRPGGVPEVPAQLTGDRGHGERSERSPEVRVEALDGLEHAQHGDLDEVVEGSPLLAKRLAQCSASQRWSSMSRLRSRRSPVVR